MERIPVTLDEDGLKSVAATILEDLPAVEMDVMASSRIRSLSNEVCKGNLPECYLKELLCKLAEVKMPHAEQLAALLPDCWVPDWFYDQAKREAIFKALKPRRDKRKSFNPLLAATG